MHVGVWHHIDYGAGSHEDLQAWRDYATTGPAPYTAIFDHPSSTAAIRCRPAAASSKYQRP